MKITLRMKNYMILSYTLFIFVLITALGFTFYRYNVHIFEEREYESMSNIASKTVEQLENLVKDMDSVALEVISNRRIVDKLAVDNGSKVLSSVISDVELRNHLLEIETFRQIVDKRIDRISVFDRQGGFYTTGRNTMISALIPGISDQDWFRETEKNDGRKFLRSPYRDYWNQDRESQVFSLSRLIRNSQAALGIVEIQQEMEMIEEVFSIDLDYEYVLLDKSRQIIFSSDSVPQEILDHLLPNDLSGVKVNNHLLHRLSSDYLNWQLFILQNPEEQMSKTRLIRNLTFLTALLIIGFSFIFIIRFSSVISQPIIRLTGNINKMDLNRLSVPSDYESIYEETNQLNDAFLRLYKRLDSSIKETYRFQNMQLKAHFDLLQAQINPHFMYNTLAVIANMGDEADQSNISDACYDLIEMLRYSNDVDQQWATLGDEIRHTVKYLELMKKRYEHRLEYGIDVDEKLMSVHIPKLVLQPMVENSLKHGFDNYIVDTMKVKIVGKVEDDFFKLCICDNGCGFDDEVLRNINRGIEEYKEKILNHADADPLTMGGMGILSTFARLYIAYKDSLIYSIENDDSGTIITIGGSLRLKGDDNPDEL